MLCDLIVQPVGWVGPTTLTLFVNENLIMRMSFFNTHSICLLTHYRALTTMSFLSMIMSCLWPYTSRFATIEIQPIEMTGGCAEIATSCCYFRQRFAQSSRGTRLAPTNPVSVDTVHKEMSDPTAATAQTSCVRSDLQQTRSGRSGLVAVGHLSVHNNLYTTDTEG